MKINREQLHKLYMEKVHEMCEKYDWISTFGPKDIVDMIAEIMENNPSLMESNAEPASRTVEDYCLMECPACGEKAWDRYICHMCGHKNL